MADHVAYDVAVVEPSGAPGVPYARVTLDAPHRNALSTAVLDELQAAFDRATADDVRAVLLQGAGPAFCSGMDLAEALADGVGASTHRLAGLLRTILALPKPVVARVHGPVRAGGIGLVAACDVALSAGTVSYAFTEARLGLAPAVISLTVLPRMTPRAASHRFLAGAPFTAAEAAACGLVTAAVEPDALDDAVATVLTDLAAGDPQGLAATKGVLNAGVLRHFDERAGDLVDLSVRLFASEPARAAMAALLRRPG